MPPGFDFRILVTSRANQELLAMQTLLKHSLKQLGGELAWLDVLVTTTHSRYKYDARNAPHNNKDKP